MTNSGIALLKSLLIMRDGLSDDLADRNEESRQIANEIHGLDAKIDDSAEALYALHYDTDPGVIIMGDVAVVGRWDSGSYFVVSILPVWHVEDLEEDPEGNADHANVR